MDWRGRKTELVYTYAMESSKDMTRMLDEEFWKRLGPTVEPPVEELA